MSEIRVLAEEEYPELMRIVLEAYPRMGVTSREAIEKQIERFRTSRRDPDWTPYGVFRDGRMVGVFRNFDFVLNVRGHLLSAGGLGLVAVDLTHKKEHIAKDIVESFLAHYDDRGDAMTTLWPFRVDFYHRMGFGLGSTMHEYRVKPHSLPVGKGKDHVRYLTENDIPALADCYNRHFEKQNGMIRHNEGHLQNCFEFGEKLRFVGCEINGRLEGYLVYSFKTPEHPTSLLGSNLVVSELCYHTSEALSELLAFLHTQHDQVDRVILPTPDDEFYFLMSDPTAGSAGEIPPNYHESHVCGVGIMYRVIDGRRLFEQLTQPCFGDPGLTVKITLRDSFLPKNDGSLTVQFRDGHGVVTDSDRFDVEIRLDVAEFSSMIMGAVGFRRLHAYGLADISDPALLDQVEALFTYRQKPVCVTPF